MLKTIEYDIRRENESPVIDLVERVKELEARLNAAESKNESDSAEIENAVSRLHEKEEECVCLQARLQNYEAKFAEFKRQVDKTTKVQMKAYGKHNEQVKSLKTLAEKDRVWLEEETSRRRAASIANRKNSEARITRMHRRLTAGW